MHYHAGQDVTLLFIIMNKLLCYHLFITFLKSPTERNSFCKLIYFKTGNK